MEKQITRRQSVIFPRIPKSLSQSKKGLAKKDCSSGLKDKFKSIDIYGQQINLTYKGDDQFKTSPGAAASLVVMFILCAYTGYRLFILINKINPNVSKQSFIRDLDSEEPFKPTEYGFDLAFGVGSSLDPAYGYYTANIIHYYYSKNETDSSGNPKRYKEKIPLDFKACGTEYFKFDDQTQVTTYGLDKYMCFTNKDYALQGDFYSQEFSYLEIKLFKCKTNCANKTAMDSYFDNARFNFAFVNSYFDFSEYDGYIKPFIDDSLFWELESNRIKKVNFYIMKSETQLEDTIFQLGQQTEDEFAQVQNQRTYDDQYSEADGYLVAMFIRFDKNYDIYNRQVYSILTFLGDIGGLQQSLFIIGLAFVGFFSHRILVSSILRKIYQIKRYIKTNKTEETNRKSSQGNESVGHKSNSVNNSRVHLNTLKMIPQDIYDDQEQLRNRTQMESPSPDGKYEREMTPKTVLRKNKMSRFSLQNSNNLLRPTINDINLQSQQSEQVKKITANNSNVLGYSLQPQNQKSEDRVAGHSLRQTNNNSFITEWRQNENSASFLHLNQAQPPHGLSTDVSKDNLRVDKIIKDRDMLTEKDITKILLNLINRKRFNYATKNVINYIFSCFCLKKVDRKNRQHKKHFLYQKGEKKLQEELDVVTILRSMRQVRLLTQALLNQKQKLILRFQRRNLIETSSSSEDSDNNNQFDSAKLMESKNPMIRLVIFGKMKRMITSYNSMKLKQLDKRLLRGLFLRKLKDFDEEYAEKVSNKTLLNRLKMALLTNNNTQDEFSASHRNLYEASELDAMQATKDVAPIYFSQQRNIYKEDDIIFANDMEGNARNMQYQLAFETFKPSGEESQQNRTSVIQSRGSATEEILQSLEMKMSHQDQDYETRVFKYFHENNMHKLEVSLNNDESSDNGVKRVGGDYRQSRMISIERVGDNDEL